MTLLVGLIPPEISIPMNLLMTFFLGDSMVKLASPLTKKFELSLLNGEMSWHCLPNSSRQMSETLTKFSVEFMDSEL